MTEAQPILCPRCHKPNLRRARFCQHCGHDVVLNNDGPRYYITRIIKEGGQGAVYEAIDDRGHVYAAKEMLDRFTNSKERDEALVRFDTEATFLQHLAHPRIPKVYSAFKDEGRSYLVMDFVRGEDLEDIIKREGAINEKQVLIWADQICDVLEYLHHQNPPIIFRDMKPSNIMIERDGSLKLIDFGIAKVFQPAQRGTQIGTPGYAPPEQYQGRATPTSDVYSLGATLHHLLTGRDPRDEERPSFTFPPVRNLKPAVSQRTSDTIARAVQFQEDQRFQSIIDFRNALRPAPAAPPPQVRVAPAQAPARPQVASAPPAASSPAKAQTPPPPPAKAQTPPPPPAKAQMPAAQSVPAVPNTPIATPAPPAVQSPRPMRLSGCLFGLVAIVLIAATLYFAFPTFVSSVLPNILPGATATPQTLIQQRFTMPELEIVVPAGRNVRDVYTEVFLSLARQQFGPTTRLNSNAMPAFLGEPQKISEDANGTKYRASMEGFVLVPR